jgi:hypothetical protein
MRLVIVWLVCMAAGTLAPFDFGDAAGTRVGGLFQYGTYQQQADDFVWNLLLFIPFGVLVHHEGHRRSFEPVFINVVVATAAFLLSTTVECAQAFLPSRDSSLIDILANTTGALIGATTDRAWGRPAASLAGWLRIRTSPRHLAGITAIWAVLALLLSSALQARTRLSNWRADYPLLIGNEGTGDRLWRGRVLGLTMTDAPTVVASVRRFADGGDIVLPGTRVAAFDFSGDAPYEDATGSVPNLRWVHRSTANAWLQSDGPAAILAQRLRASNAFTIRVRLTSDDSNQPETARIVSNSVSPFRRNFTLGQLGDDLVVRLRTRLTGDNGARFQTYVPDVFLTREVRDILVTYDGATLLAATHAGHVVSRTSLGPGSAVAAGISDRTFERTANGQIALYDIAYLGALFLPPAVLIGILGHNRSDQIWLAAGYLCAFTVLLEITLILTSSRAFDWSSVGATGGTGALVFLVVIGTASAPGSRREAARALSIPAHPRFRT